MLTTAEVLANANVLAQVQNPANDSLAADAASDAEEDAALAVDAKDAILALDATVV
jgi:hypothetical protein